MKEYLFLKFCLQFFLWNYAFSFTFVFFYHDVFARFFLNMTSETSFELNLNPPCSDVCGIRHIGILIATILLGFCF